ncbi:MAG: hypothetical protein DMD69_12330 [Gemmatimonadetes bacterium]|nr:MAG: hypothetical protein DMD69_12330 [Gemmatimonadota bacterium]
MRRIWTNCPTVKRCTTTILSAAALLVGCDRGPDRPPPTAAAPRGGPQADLSGQINAVLDVLQLGSNLLAMSDPKAAAEELPGMGHKFELFGVMVDDVDPDNATNDVISNVTTPTDLGFAFRSFPPGIQIAALDGQINLKYYFVAPRSCGGGSPRITLLVDANGDGQFGEGDFAAHGHVNPPSTLGCVPDVWHIEDMTDLMNRWEVTPGTALVPTCGPGGAPTMCTWDELEARVTAMYPNHRILAGFLLDGESCAFPFPPGCGKAYYDLLTLENRTLENRQDTVH